MNDSNGYAVFFYPQALEALGDAIKPYLQDNGPGPHVLCNEIDTGGALIEMTLHGLAPDGRELSLELMVPSGMVRMVVSTHSDGLFGFGPHAFEKAALLQAPQASAVPAETAGTAPTAPSPAPLAPAEKVDDAKAEEKPAGQGSSE